jgi:hypothetical protein
MKKKAQVNQIFVYLFSIIVILFVSYMIANFVISFWSETKSTKENIMFENLKRDYNSIYTNWGAEKPFSYDAGEDKTFLCFVESFTFIKSCEPLDDNKKKILEEITKNRDNIILFGENEYIRSDKIGPFRVSGGCLCVNSSLGKFNILIENDRNLIRIYDIIEFQ